MIEGPADLEPRPHAHDGCMLRRASDSCKLRPPAGAAASEFFELLSEQAASPQAARHLVDSGFLPALVLQLVQRADLLLCAESEMDIG